MKYKTLALSIAAFVVSVSANAATGVAGNTIVPGVPLTYAAPSKIEFNTGTGSGSSSISHQIGGATGSAGNSNQGVTITTYNQQTGEQTGQQVIAYKNYALTQADNGTMITSLANAQQFRSDVVSAVQGQTSTYVNWIANTAAEVNAGIAVYNAGKYSQYSTWAEASAVGQAGYQLGQDLLAFNAIITNAQTNFFDPMTKMKFFSDTTRGTKYWALSNDTAGGTTFSSLLVNGVSTKDYSTATNAVYRSAGSVNWASDTSGSSFVFDY